MARPRQIDQALVAQAQKVVAAATDVRQLRAAQAVLLPALFQASLEQTASLLGVGRATVARLQARFRAQSTQPQPPSAWGGRRRALLSVAEEKEFISRWQAKAQAGECVPPAAIGDVHSDDESVHNICGNGGTMRNGLENVQANHTCDDLVVQRVSRGAPLAWPPRFSNS